MKICFISQYIYPLFNSRINKSSGGSEQQIFLLSKQLSRLSHEVTLITGDYGQNKIEKIEDINIRKFSPSHANIPIDYLKASFSLIKNIIETRADVYIQRAAGPETGIVCLITKLLHKRFIYMTAHEIDCSGEYIKKNGLLGQLYKYGLLNANIIVAQTGEQKRLLKENYNINAKIINNSVNIIKLKPKKRKYVLWVARLEKWKRPEAIIKLAKDFPREAFLIVGPSSSDISYAKNISESISNIQNITYMSFVSRSEILDYYSKAKVFINTSLYEGFPNTFLEAGVSKTPIISMKVNPDNIFDKCGLCSNDSYILLKDQLKRLLRDQSTRDTITSNMYKYTKTNHDINKNVVKLLKILK